MPSLGVQVVVAQDAFTHEAQGLQCLGERGGATRWQQYEDAMQADIVEQERAQRAQCGLWMGVAVLQRLQFCAARMQ